MIMWVSRGTVVGPEVTIGHSTKDRDRGFRVVVSPWSYAWFKMAAAMPFDHLNIMYWGFLWMTMVAQHDEERASILDQQHELVDYFIFAAAECYHMEIIVEIGANCTLHGDRDRTRVCMLCGQVVDCRLTDDKKRIGTLGSQHCGAASILKQYQRKERRRMTTEEEEKLWHPSKPQASIPNWVGLSFMDSSIYAIHAQSYTKSISTFKRILEYF
ncbi:hypothetical protein NC653_010078 [Populus alba x Populus x berolinensis]|uniref:Uncharacterized protein n=1 Tax=Populus alba x Populus x berolinensis TaxID=444605 RepID=A0AAD6QYX7_9ROSI|nr:hypothetical protein NC653_010078 [Populus alba x Populus x berolinensis]